MTCISGGALFPDGTVVKNSAIKTGKSSEASRVPDRRISSIFLTAVWFGVVAGYGEGLGLLSFQRINWAQWAKVMHVSKEILWISPIVDICFFLLVALVVAMVSRISPRIPGIRILAVLLVFLTAYDWLLVTGRLYRVASLFLAFGVAMAFNRWLGNRESSALRIWRRSGPWLAVSLAVAIVAMEGGQRLYEARAVSRLPPAAPQSPNVLLIVLDTLRADHVSSYGYPRLTSPEIDRIASQGVLFENAIAPSSWSLPSHASLVTGRAVHEHGLGNVQPMPWLGWRDASLQGLPTLGEALERQGYRTAAFSANRIYFTSNVGLGRGFIHFEDYFDSVGDSFVRSEFGGQFARRYMNRSGKSKITRAFRYFGLGSWLDKDSEGSGDSGGAFGIRKRADEVNREAVQWIEGDRQHPFLAFLTYLDVHYRYGGPANYSKPSWDQGTTIDEYDAGLKYDDDFIGRLLHRLDELSLLKNTIVIITSDHGESLGDHGLSFHGAALYWELVHVPLIISWPGRVPEGVRVHGPVTNAAIANTVLDLVGANANRFPGPSLRSFWQPNAPQDWPYPISELPQTNTIVAADRALQGKVPIATDGWMKSVVSPRWHLIVHEKLGDQLYDWTSDRGEMRNRANTPEGRAAIAALVSGRLNDGHNEWSRRDFAHSKSAEFP